MPDSWWEVSLPAAQLVGGLTACCTAGGRPHCLLHSCWEVSLPAAQLVGGLTACCTAGGMADSMLGM